MKTEKPSVLNILARSDLFESKGQIRRLISQGAVKLDAERVEDAELMVTKSSSIIKAGKKNLCAGSQLITLEVQSD